METDGWDYDDMDEDEKNPIIIIKENENYSTIYESDNDYNQQGNS